MFPSIVGISRVVPISSFDRIVCCLVWHISLSLELEFIMIC